MTILSFISNFSLVFSKAGFKAESFFFVVEKVTRIRSDSFRERSFQQKQHSLKITKENVYEKVVCDLGNKNARFTEYFRVVVASICFKSSPIR